MWLYISVRHMISLWCSHLPSQLAFPPIESVVWEGGEGLVHLPLAMQVKGGAQSC